jgi:hypothetical protein
MCRKNIFGVIPRIEKTGQSSASMRGLGKAILKNEPLLRQDIDRWCGFLFVSVAGKMIRPCGIQKNDDRLPGPLLFTPNRQKQNHEQKNAERFFDTGHVKFWIISQKRS